MESGYVRLGVIADLPQVWCRGPRSRPCGQLVMWMWRICTTVTNSLLGPMVRLRGSVLLVFVKVRAWRPAGSRVLVCRVWGWLKHLWLRIPWRKTRRGCGYVFFATFTSAVLLVISTTRAITINWLSEHSDKHTDHTWSIVCSELAIGPADGIPTGTGSRP